MNIIKPPALRSGDKVAIISPASPGISVFPNRTQRAIKALQTFGLDPVMTPNAREVLRGRGGSPQQRASDIIWALENPEISGLISAIGGLNSNEVLPHLDFSLFRKFPKILVGYSDVTALLMAVHQRSGLVTFHGPALLSEWGEFPTPFEATQKSFHQICFEGATHTPFPPLAQWTDEYAEWSEEAIRDLPAWPRRLHPPTGWRWLTEGEGTGRLIGGNVDTINILCGTPYLSPPREETIVFLEAVAMSENYFRRALTQLVQAGFFETCRGVIWGKYHPQIRAQNREEENWRVPDPHALDHVVQELLGHYDIPLVTGVDIGHTDPKYTLPLGTLFKISSLSQSIELCENAVTTTPVAT